MGVWHHVAPNVSPDCNQLRNISIHLCNMKSASLICVLFIMCFCRVLIRIKKRLWFIKKIGCGHAASSNVQRELMIKACNLESEMRVSFECRGFVYEQHIV